LKYNKHLKLYKYLILKYKKIMHDSHNIFLAGFLTGGIQTIIGHPLDTIKVLLQTNNKKNIKLNGLYNGLKYPLLTQSCVSSVLFGSFNFFKKYNLNNMNAGICSGVLTGIILTPIELLKIKEQTNNKINFKKLNYNLFTGLKPTILRECLGNGIYFYSYYELKNNNYPIIVSGGIAGCLSWLFSYPFDVIKSRIQINSSLSIYKAYEMGNLFNGISPCLFRATLINAVGFYCLENIKNILDNF